MTGWGGRRAGRISATVVVVLGLTLAGVGIASARPATGPDAGLEAAVPPVTLPPVTVPLLHSGGLTAPVDDVLNGARDAANGAVAELGGVLAGMDATGGAPAIPTPTVPPGTGSASDDTVSSAGATGARGATTAGERRRAEERAARRLARLVGSGTPVAAVALPATPVDPLDDAVQQDARHFGWPLVLGLLIALFLAVQHRADRHERKLADAPLDQGERLRFR